MTAVIWKDLEQSLLILVVAKRCIAFSRRMNMHPHQEDQLTTSHKSNTFCLCYEKVWKYFLVEKISLLDFGFMSILDLPPHRRCTWWCHFLKWKMFKDHTEACKVTRCYQMFLYSYIFALLLSPFSHLIILYC